VSAAERILAWPREAQGPVSGAELARRLGCTRTAVWKQVRALRTRGWEIAGRPAAGYRLLSEPSGFDGPALAAAVGGNWARVVFHDVLDSTQGAARALAEGGAPEGTVVVADRQTSGRGRLGRDWHSPAGVNLYATVVLRPPLPPARVPQLALVAGLAVADAIAAETGTAAELKWPNDVLVGGRKTAGVLTEMQGELERVRYVLVGMGVNLNETTFPAALRGVATSVRLATGRPVDRARFTARLLAALEARYGRFLSGGLASMRADWESLSCLQGRTVQVTAGDHVTRGRVCGIDDEGALLLEDSTGTTRRVTAGEVTLRREEGA
jgi:BirA family biotin operon repressor/biotin-[acetyl-CoA-carboxylase] ligase